MNNQTFSIETLTGNNYKRWKEDVELAFDMMDIDVAIKENRPPALTERSTEQEKIHYRNWERANLKALMMLKRSISDTLLMLSPNLMMLRHSLIPLGNGM